MNTLALDQRLAHIDKAKRLPPASADRMERLRRKHAESRAISGALIDETLSLHPELQRLQTRIRFLKSPRGSGGGGLADDDTRVVAEQTALDECKRRLAQIQAHDAEGEPVRRALNNLLTHAEKFIENNDRNLHASDAKLPPLKRGQTTIDLIEQKQRRLRELDADAHRVRCAPLPSAIAKQRMRDEIEPLAERGRVGVEALIEHDGELRWPRVGRFALVANANQGAVARWEDSDTLAIFCWLNGSALLKKLDTEIDAVADDAAALSPDEKATKLAEIAADKLVVEREECEWIWHAIDAGMSIVFRADTDPRALLGLA